MLSPELKDLLQAAANFVTTFGILFAIAGLFLAIRTHRSEREKDRLQKEYATFDDLDDKYVEFMYKCSEHPDLDLFSVPADPKRQLSSEQIHTERALYSVLISIFERAYIMFERQADDDTRTRQYPGWKNTMKAYCLRESFLHEWKNIGDQFDCDFQLEMNQIIQQATTDSEISKQSPVKNNA